MNSEENIDMKKAKGIWYLQKNKRVKIMKKRHQETYQL